MPSINDPDNGTFVPEVGILWVLPEMAEINILGPLWATDMSIIFAQEALTEKYSQSELLRNWA